VTAICSLCEIKVVIKAKAAIYLLKMMIAIVRLISRYSSVTAAAAY